ncbi:MAG: phage holin family protein [Patescibacteria group bacterium]|nr:phage holin family protein [Patescibacteria group bacterium]
MHLFLSWVVNTAALMITAYLIPGIKINNVATAFVAALVLGLINTFIRPALILLTLPINFLTLGLFTLVVNALMLFLVTKIVPGFNIDNFWPTALLGALVLSIVSTILGTFKR